MKKYLVVMFAVAFLLAGFLFVDSRGPSAQRITKPTPEKQQVMPEVVVLGKNAKLGRVTFNHLKHNGGEYNAGGPIACI
ncbi:MAG TPA: hypothetical protein PK108_12765, partial [Pyrinomonadaceae bacterium]|nr:hypothetical protein [Pyrinomonadaceae bacterium]